MLPGFYWFNLESSLMDQDTKTNAMLSQGTRLMTQPEMLEKGRQASQLLIGLPRETSFSEKRITLVPDAVRLLTDTGHGVMIENGAGKEAGFTDHHYAEAGAQIVYSRDEVYKAELVLKVAPPTNAEIALLRPRQVIISSLNISVLERDFFVKVSNRKATALAFEYIHDSSGSIPLVRAMSEIAGNAAIYIATRYLIERDNQVGVMLGGFSGIPPTEVVILGAGTVGEYAARAALGMGAQVKIFDNSLYKLRRIQTSLQNRVFTSIIDPRVLRKVLETADVVIGAVHATEGRTPCFISEDMVRGMTEGAVIIDLSIDHGGCVETSAITTHEQPVFRKHGVVHYCVPNIPSMVSQTASQALSNFFCPLLLQIGDAGGMENLLRQDDDLRKGVYLFNGSATNRFIADYYELPFQDIGLLMAAFR